ncbi:MAG: hypothetical protein QM653_07250 [Dysgonomonas sp.]|uniref:ATP-binding domain-containing protein n=1 Tax=Dysgonomonas sp. TaxID=1891233 RepID=UPI0039E71575
MKEHVQEIAKRIHLHRETELHTERTNEAIGRVKAIYDNVEQQFWITNKTTSRIEKTDFNGNVIPGSGLTIDKPCEDDGRAIYKNSKLGELLITNHQGTYTFNAPIGNLVLEIFNQSLYNPSKDYKEGYANDLIIKIAGEESPHIYTNLAKILILQDEIDKLKEKADQADQVEAQNLLTRIREKEEEIKQYINKKQNFVRRYAQLRDQHILDPQQEKIKRSKIFDTPLIINGGPGTGKTTSLIQRIKFLISPTIEEYKEDLNREQKEKLFDPKSGWIFFSPSKLLALFLENNMTNEGLLANEDTVKVWADHKNNLLKPYGLINTDIKRPFMMYHKADDKSLFVNPPQGTQSVIEGLEKFYLNFQKDKLNKIAEIETDNFKWKNTGTSIKNFIHNKKEINNVEDLIRLFQNLNENYEKESKQISEEYSECIKIVVSRIHVIINKDQKRINTLSELFKEWRNDSLNTEDDDDDDDSVIESEDFEETEDLPDFEGILFSKLKSLCRKQALKKYDNNTRFSKRDRELLKLIPEAEKQEEYEQLGQTAFFKKYFERLIKGIVANVLREIPMIYKKYRREQLVKQSADWDNTILRQVVTKDKNSRLHPDERALLLYFINKTCFVLAKRFPQQFDTLNHPYIVAYKKNCRPIIGIDEATDFSLIDLLAMNSFSHPLISSVTLSGDIMQRMTNNGIHSWYDFANIVSGTTITDLTISYRQSPTLLSLAKNIYERSTDQPANYSPFIKKDENEPTPLIFISQDEEEKQAWIASRIIEIYNAYGGEIPSIAIFLPTEEQLESFANELGKVDTLSDVGINVRACKDGNMLGDKNCVRVFAIDKIKGLEFEAVFFHNLDQLENQHISNDLLLKYLYVGLSRATFYLGLTVSDELPADMQFIENSFDKSEKTW